MSEINQQQTPPSPTNNPTPEPQTQATPEVNLDPKGDTTRLQEMELPQETDQFFSGELSIDAGEIPDGQKYHKGVASLKDVISRLPEKYRQTLQNLQIDYTRKTQEIAEIKKALLRERDVLQKDKQFILEQTQTPLVDPARAISAEQVWENPDLLSDFVRQQAALTTQEKFQGFSEKLKQETAAMEIQAKKEIVMDFIRVNPEAESPEIVQAMRPYLEQGLNLQKSLMLAKVDLEEANITPSAPVRTSEYQQQIDRSNHKISANQALNKISGTTKKGIQIPDLSKTKLASEKLRAWKAFEKQYGRLPTEQEKKQAYGKNR